MTANCNRHHSLQVYGESIKNVTDFKYLGSKMASAAIYLKRRKVLAWSAFYELKILWKGSQLIHLCEIVVILYPLCDNFCLWL